MAPPTRPDLPFDPSMNRVLHDIADGRVIRATGYWVGLAARSPRRWSRWSPQPAVRVVGRWWRDRPGRDPTAAAAHARDRRHQRLRAPASYSPDPKEPARNHKSADDRERARGGCRGPAGDLRSRRRRHRAGRLGRSRRPPSARPDSFAAVCLAEAAARAAAGLVLLTLSVLPGGELATRAQTAANTEQRYRTEAHQAS
jgi:hypothetical protein